MNTSSAALREHPKRDHKKGSSRSRGQSRLTRR